MICKVDTQTDGTFRLKVVTIIVGILDVILASVGSCGDRNDIFFLVTILIIFSFSFLHLTCSLLDVFKANCTSRGVDFLFHVIGGFMILITSIVILSGTDAKSCHVMEKTSAATVGIFNAFLYLYVCWLLLQLLRRKDRDGTALPLYIFCGISRIPVFPCEDQSSFSFNDKRKFSSSAIPMKLTSSHSAPTTQESMVVLKGGEREREVDT